MKSRNDAPAKEQETAPVGMFIIYVFLIFNIIFIVERVKKDETLDLRTRAGGAYIPPAKLKLMQEQIKDKV